MATERFLIIDDNPESRMLLTKSLLRKHPEAVSMECQNGETAVALARDEELTAIIAHRTYDYDGERLVTVLREANARVPIVMVSGHDRSAVALAAGADAFLHYDGWLKIAAVVDEAIVARERANTQRPKRRVSSAGR